jgi:hypothetical protein
MSSVVETITKPFSEVIDKVGKIADQAISTVGHALESVGREVEKIGQAAVNDPIGTIAKVAAVATQQYWALPVISAADVVAHGGNLEQAATAAGVSVAASWAGGTIAAEIASPAADSAAGMITQDAAEMAKSGLGADQIQQVLQQSYPEVSSEILNSISNASVAGISANTLASAYAGAFGSALNGTLDMTAQQIAAVPLGNAAANFAKTLVQTNGDVGKALLAGTGAGAGTAFGNIVSSEMSGAGVNGSIAQVTGKITAAATSGIIQGQDPSKALGTALVNNIISTSYAQAGGLLKDAWAQSGVNKLFSEAGTSVVNDLNKTAADQKTTSDQATALESKSNGIVSQYDSISKTASDYYKNTVTPAENEAKALQAAANASYDAYKPIRDQFSDYVNQYNTTKSQYDLTSVPDKQTDDDGNVTNQDAIDRATDEKKRLADQMNTLADKANVLVPQLNTATDKYNADATAYQTSADKLNNIASTYTKYNDQLGSLKTDYTNTTAQFRDTVTTANQLTDKFNTTTDQLQKQIDQIITDKKTADEQMANMSDAAKLAYQNSFSTGNMQPLEAFQIGQQVSQLSDTAQNAFNQSFKEKGDVQEALSMAKDVSGLSSSQQELFARGVDSGLQTTEAISYAPKLDNVSGTSQTAFMDSVKEGNGPTDAMKLADNVNALSDTNQALYAKVKDNTDLTTQNALDSTNGISNFATKAQDAYINGVNDKLDMSQALKTANVVNDGVSASELPTQLKESYLNFIDKGGMSADQALASAKSLTSLSTAAVDAFNENYKKTTDQTAALNIATQVSSMSLPQQQTFLQSTNTGLTQDQALVAAKNITGMNSGVQSAYINAVKNGADANLATNAAAIAGFFEAQNTPVTDKSVVLSTDGTNAIIKNLGTGVVTEVPLMSGAGVGTLLGKTLDVIVPSAQAGELPKNPQPDNPNVVQEVYQKNPMGGWSTVIPDGKGGYTTIAQQAIPGNFTPKEGEGTGKWYNNAPADGQGFPQEVQPIAPPPPDPNAVTAQNPIVDATASADGKTVIYKDSLGGTQTVDLTTGKVVSETPPTSNPITDLAGQISKYYDPNAITPQDFSGSIFTGKTATSPTGTTGTGTGTATIGGTGAGTTGTGTTGGATTGTGTGTGTTAGTGTGTGTGTTGTTGTGTAGTGTGAGGEGTGTGAGGTGAGTGAGGTGTGTGAGGTGTGTRIGGTATGTGGGGFSTGLSSTDATGGIKNLTPGLTQRMDYTLTGEPVIQEALNPTNLAVPQFATGGTTSSQYDPYATGTSGISGSLTPGLTKAQLQYILTGMPGANITAHAEGGAIEEHNPQFFSEGGLGSIENRYVQGEGDGTSDSVAAMLANGEFVIPADVVSKLGNGSNEAGAGVLDHFLVEIRKHAQSNGTKLPPESKGPLAYLLDAKRKVKA